MKDDCTQALLQALGLCAKAGKLIYGSPMILESLRGGKKPLLVLAASDNSPNSAKRLQDKCTYYHISLVQTPVRGEALAHAVGKGGHLAAVAITDVGLCRLVERQLLSLSSESEG